MGPQNAVQEHTTLLLVMDKQFLLLLRQQLFPRPVQAYIMIALL